MTNQKGKKHKKIEAITKFSAKSVLFLVPCLIAALLVWGSYEVIRLCSSIQMKNREKGWIVYCPSPKKSQQVSELRKRGIALLMSCCVFSHFVTFYRRNVRKSGGEQ
jgi:hypothetical protein